MSAFRLPDNLHELVAAGDGMLDLDGPPPVAVMIHINGNDALEYQGSVNIGEDDRARALAAALAGNGFDDSGHGWSDMIMAYLQDRHPDAAKAIHDDSEDATCVLHTTSEPAFMALVNGIVALCDNPAMAERYAAQED